jgi:hypothetical protein
MLAHAYERNEIAAEERYGGKRVTMIGRIRRIGETFGGTPYVSLEAANLAIGFQCFFSKEDKPKLVAYSVGTTVAITGTV